jgi:hypothetical protein
MRYSENLSETPRILYYDVILPKTFSCHPFEGREDGSEWCQVNAYSIPYMTVRIRKQKLEASGGNVLTFDPFKINGRNLQSLLPKGNI